MTPVMVPVVADWAEARLAKKKPKRARHRRARYFGCGGWFMGTKNIEGLGTLQKLDLNGYWRQSEHKFKACLTVWRSGRSAAKSCA